MPDQGGADRLDARQRLDRELAGSGTQGATGNSGVAKIVKGTDGAIGYVDFSDAKASELTFASIKNSGGKYIAPNLVSAAAAARGATVNADLTYDPLNATGAGAYPITSPTWIIVYKDQTDAAKGNGDQGVPQLHLRAGPEAGPGRSTTRRCPRRCSKQAKAQVKQITVPASVTSGGSCTGRVPPARPVPPLDDLQLA